MLKAVESASTSQANSEKEISIQPVSLDIWDKKYRLKTKSGEHVDADMDASYARVARALADVETTDEKRAEWHKNFYGPCVVAPFRPAALHLMPVR